MACWVWVQAGGRRLAAEGHQVLKVLPGTQGARAGPTVRKIYGSKAAEKTEKRTVFT